MSMLDMNALAAAPVAVDPFKYFVATDLLDPETLKEIQVDFPEIDAPGIFPLSDLTYGPAFRTLINEIRSSELESVMARKFEIDLADKPLMITVRGRCQEKDGRIHTDTESKLVTVLLYLNDIWDKGGGRLRFLHGPDDVTDAIAEVPPNGGTLVAFRRSDLSYHGHESYVGQRRYVMFNWMSTEAAAQRQIARHHLSATIKRFLPFA
tara:strand:- start:549 stop:1172 length:624 start_codon:yes stop_codon:yes gene_type:complete